MPHGELHPTFGPAGKVYHLYLTPHEDRQDRNWILQGQGNSRPTVKGDYDRARRKANELLSHNGSAFCVMEWKYSSKHGWSIETIYLNRRYRSKLSGRSVAARADRI